MANIPAGILQQQATAQAPGQGLEQQAQPKNQKVGTKSPGKGQQKGKGKPQAANPAKALYPNNPTQE